MRLSVAVVAVCMSIVGLANADDVHAAIRKPTRIPPQALVPALKQLAHERGFQLVFQTEVVGAATTRGANGDLSVSEALKQLLEGTNLVFDYIDDRTITIRPAAANPTTLTTSDPGVAGTPSLDASNEAKRSGGGSALLAQSAGEQRQAIPSAEGQEEHEDKRKPILEEVVVTGSRIPTKNGEGAQDVKIYTREQIDQSGQSTIADFLNTLPSVAVAVTEQGVHNFGGQTTVQLRGLPYGTTLVLLNGRRIETSGTQSLGDFFDLNNVPVGAVERIEVVADGSSAVYGSDAIAGVVNIVLRRDFSGFEASARYGSADGTHDSDASIAWGKRWDKGSISLTGDFKTRSELDSSKRALTRSNDYTAYGGLDTNFHVCNPGNVFSVTTDANGNPVPLPGAPPGSNASFAAITGTQTGRPTFGNFTYGKLNECPFFPTSPIPPTHRAGAFAQGSYFITPSIELFTELMYSHVDQTQSLGNQYLFGDVGFQSFTVSASNPYNPFGETIGVAEKFSSINYSNVFAADFIRPVLGVRGKMLTSWEWEMSAWQSADFTRQRVSNAYTDFVGLQNALNSSDPATALNPFVAGSPAKQQELQSFFSDGIEKFAGRGTSVNGFVRGPLEGFPSGAIDLVLGAEYDRGAITASGNGGPKPFDFRRNSYALFGEARIPIIANRGDPTVGDTLAVSLAARHDHYDVFGSTNNPQVGIQWRPLPSFLVRASYAGAFKAPPLGNLYVPNFTFNTGLTDPSTGKPILVPAENGGNPNLRAERGHSHSFGVVWSDPDLANLELKVSSWRVTEDNFIEFVPAQVLLDNENLFPDRVIRDASGNVTKIIDTYINAGKFDVAGVDYQLTNKIQTNFGTLLPSLSVTQTYHFTSKLTSVSPAIDGVSVAQDTGNWAPRWKGSLRLGWELGELAANAGGRYVGRYRDYDSTQIIGNFWLCDLNLRYGFGKAWAPTNSLLKGSYVELGGVNIFNRLPQFSSFLFDNIGYDPAQGDIRGRFLYAKLGLSL